MIISTSQASMEDLAINEDNPEVQSAVSEVRQGVVQPGQHKERFDRVLVDLAPEFSRNYLQKLMADDAVQLDGIVVKKPSTRVLAGQKVVIELRPTPDVLAFRAEKLPLDIVYEDEHLLVINKPAGLVVHPGAGNWSGTLLNGLLAHDAQAFHLPRAGIVHRLDKDTSGLMVVGRTLQACTALVKMFAVRGVKRDYVALVHGAWPKGDQNKVKAINAPIGRDPRSRTKMAVHPQGKPAQTDASLLDGNEEYSLLLCQLHTGRTHQIRVHLASIGAPLVGDVLYGGRVSCNMNRQALHAFKLSFMHPISSQTLSFEQKWPTDLSCAVKIAKLGYNLL